MSTLRYTVLPATTTSMSESWVRDPILEDLPLLALTKLSDSCCQRLLDFSKWPKGWGGEDSLAIATPTLFNLKNFLEAVHVPTSRRPSLFLTRSGYVQIMVRDAANRRVDVILTPTGIEYFFEATDEEGSVPADEIGVIAGKFSARL